MGRVRARGLKLEIGTGRRKFMRHDVSFIWSCRKEKCSRSAVAEAPTEEGKEAGRSQKGNGSIVKGRSTLTFWGGWRARPKNVL